MRKKGEGTLGALTIYTIHQGGNFSCKYSEDVLLSIGKFKRKRIFLEISAVFVRLGENMVM